MCVSSRVEVMGSNGEDVKGWVDEPVMMMIVVRIIQSIGKCRMRRFFRSFCW